MDVSSYISGLVQGIIIAELLVYIIYLILGIRNAKRDMEKLEYLNQNIEHDLRFSQTIIDCYNSQAEKISKIEEKLGIKEEKSNE